MAEFQPQWDEGTLRKIIGSYKQNPTAYPETYKQTIQQHADYHGVPFYPGEFSVADALTDLGAGFIEGFTTLHIGEEPDNEYEAIFKNLGHLAGFAPGIISAPLGAAAKLTKSAHLLNAAQIARSLNDKSVPMFAAKKATEFAKKNVKPFLQQGRGAKNSAVNTATNFLLGNKARHIAEGAFHLGTASAVSAWQGGIDEMMSAFIHGGAAGGVFRSIGNFINTGSEAGNKVAKTLSGSLFMGLPSTIQGATTPEQVYQYVMGAWFGGQERPWTVAKAGKFRQKYAKDAEKIGEDVLKREWDPELHPDFEALPSEVKPVVKEMFQKEFNTRVQKESAVVELVEQLERAGKIDFEKLGKMADAPEVARIKDTIDRMRAFDKLEKESFEEGSLNDSDPGMLTKDQVTVGKRADSIIKYYAPDIFRDIELANDKMIKSEELGGKIHELIRNRLTVETGIATNDSYELVKDIQKMLKKDYNYQIKDVAIDPKTGEQRQTDNLKRFEGDIRQWLSRKNNDFPVNVISTTNGTDVRLLTQKNPNNLAGDKKVRYEPLKIIDKLYNELTNSTERAFTFLDELIVSGKNSEGKSFNKAIALSKFRQEPFNKDDYGGKKDYNKIVSNVLKTMDKQGFYYFGGKGTDDRIYFARFHPEANKIKNFKIKKFFKDSEYNKLRNKFKKDFNVSGEYFDRVFKSNVLWNLSLNGLKYSDANIKKMLGPGFIKDVVAWNKRSQVWMTDSYSGEKEFYTNENSPGHISDLTTKNDKTGFSGGSFKVSFAKEILVSKEKQALVDALSTEMSEHIDGAIIVRDDVIKSMNLDAGTFSDVTQNKAFIISPNAENGAFLGKFMFHPAGEQQTADMKSLGQHMLIQESAAKQMGTRNFQDFYELDPSHIKFNYGVKQGSEMLRPQSIKKQLLTNLVDAIAKNPSLADGTKMKDVVNDIFESVIEPRFRGTEEGNKALGDYLDKLSTASNKELLAELDKLDFDTIGLPHILEALGRKGNQLFVKKAYDEMLLKRKSSLEEDYQSGEIAREEFKSQEQELEEYNSLADKMIAAVRADAIAKGKPENEASIFVHPFINNFRMKVLSSWILGQATKPKINNSGSARIRPYDTYLQEDSDNVNKRLKDLNKNDSLFFLDKAYENMFIETETLGKRKLKDLWNLYNAKGTIKETRKELEQVFRSVVMRVPMDSISGAQVLKFSGFTGREGHGILMHSRAMRALGGADLDGDSAYFYMGGKGGFKESWKDMYEANKAEFYKTEGGIKAPIENYASLQTHAKGMINKKVGPGINIKSVELVGSVAEKGKGKDYDILYDLGKTHFEEALDMQNFGQEISNFPLKSSINNKKVDSIVKVYDINTKETYYYQTDPTVPAKWMVPVSDAIVKNIESGTKINLLKKSPKFARKETKTITENKDPEIIKDLVLPDKRGYNTYSKEATYAPNSRLDISEAAVEGRNLLGGAAVSPKQIMASAYQMIADKGSETFSIKVFNQDIDIKMIPKTSPKEKDYIRKLTRAMVGLSSDPMDYAGLKNYEAWYRKMLQAHFKIVSPINPDKIPIYEFTNNGSLGMLNKANKAFYGKDYTRDRQWSMEERRSMSEDISKLADKDITTITPKIAKLLHGLDYSDNALRKLDYKYKDGRMQGKFKELFDEYNVAVKKYDALKKALGRVTFSVPTGRYINSTMRYNLLNAEKLLKVAENDSEFAAVIKGTKFEGKPYTQEERIVVLKNIKEMAGDFAMKDIENIVTVDRVSRVVDAIKEQNPELSTSALNRIISDAHRAVSGLKAKSYLMRDARNRTDDDMEIDSQTKSRGTSELDQNQIDFEIKKWKRNKSDLEKKLFDNLMLGSLDRGKLSQIEALKVKRANKTITNIESSKLEKLIKDASRTSSSRLGYNSNAMERGSIKNFLGEMADVYTEVSEHRAPKQIREEGKLLVEEPQKSENIKKGLPEESDKSLNDLLVTTDGWEGVKDYKKVELDPETKSYITDIVTHLKTENNKVAQNFGGIVRSLLNKDINILTKKDWLYLKNYLDDVKGGTLWQRIRGGKITELSQRHYMQFPETINRELMKDEIALIQKQGMFLTKEGVKMGKVIKPTQAMDVLTDGIGITNETAMGMSDNIAYLLNRKLEYLDDIPNSKDLHAMAVATRQKAEFNRIMSGDGEQSLKLSDALHYKELYEKTLKATDYEKTLKNKKYTITTEGKREQLTGEQIVKKINDTYTEFWKERHQFITGNVKKDAEGNTLKYTTKAGEDVNVIQDSILEGIPGFTSGTKKSGYIKKSKEFPTGYYDPKTRQNPVIDIPKFTNDMKAAMAKGQKIPTEFGIDGINKIARSMMIEMAKKNKDISIEDLQKLYTSKSYATGKIPFENYWSHMHFSKKIALESLKKYTKHVRNSQMTDAEMSEIMSKLTYRHHALTGDWNFEDISQWKGYDEVTSGIASKKALNEAKIRWLGQVTKPGVTMSRDAHIPGYSLDRQVPMAYSKSLINSYFRQMAQIFSRDAIDKFNTSMVKRKVDKEQRNAWTTFMKLYVQGAMGNPDVVPEAVLNDPKMKMSSTPYGWWADNKVKNRINKIGETLGILKSDMPKDLKGIDLNDLKNWSNLEAKFELASLLAHPKSVVNNIFGGTMHTIQSTGFNTWRTARNNKMMGAINPEWSSRQGRDNFAVKHGIFPEQLMEEYGLMREYQSAKNKEFIENVSRKMINDPNLSSETIRDLAKKGEITKPITELAAKFMSVPERALRRDAFMAHYLHWYRKLGGAIKDFDHPILIELAKKGVKATQFLYSAPYRPMFARTALGKVMTRFQLWGWNAVRFRKDALKQAKLYGFKGSEADKAARMMQMDLFVFALGNAFAYSLFEVAMPAPWNWVQDTSDWIFGDEKERNRAFFGQWPRAIAPLQIVTPPILRLPMSSMRAMLEDDWSRVSNYYIYTMFPFGRIIRDFHSENNLIDNPLSVVDKWTGIPLIAASKASKERKKREEEGVAVPTPGAKFY